MWSSENEAREEIKTLVKSYYKQFKNRKPFEPGDRINYSGRVFDEKEMMALTDAMLDFWLTTGRFSAQFEKEFANYLGVKYAHLVQIQPGDEVVTVACAFPTTVAPILQYGAVPVFLDVTLPEYNIDVRMLEKACSERTKAVMIAHTLGNPFNLNAVKAFCDRHRLWLVEDNCDALGSEYTIGKETKRTGIQTQLGEGLHLCSRTG